MAIGRLSVSVGPKGKAGPHAMYIAREGKYAKHNDKIEKLEATGSGNMPDWAKADPNFFWKMSDDKERKNGTAYREHVISLPRELSPEQRHDLIKAWITQEIGEKHAYQYAIHNPLAMDGGEQPHAHIMFSERLRDGIERDPDHYFKRFNAKNPDRGGAKKANTPKLADERKLELKDQRDRWEKLCNSHLELAGSDARISMRSLADQGIDREPISFSMTQIQDKTIKQAYIDLVEAKKELSSVLPSDQAITQEIKRQKSLNFDRFMQSMKDDYELQRIEVEVDQRAEKVKQARLKQEAAEKAEQARLAADRAAIGKRPPFELVNIRMESTVYDKYTRKKDNKLSGNVPIGTMINDLLKAMRDGHEVVLAEGNNSHLNNNKTAQSIKAFMLKNLSIKQVRFDYGNLGIEKFTEKYALRCDISDLEKLNDINPPEPMNEPQKLPQRQSQAIKSTLRNDDYDLGM